MISFSKYQKQPKKANHYKPIFYKKHFALKTLVFYTLAVTTMIAGGLYYGFN